MKKLSKVLCMTIFVTMIVTMFSSCKSHEATLFNAMMKSYTATSFESNTVISFELPTTEDTKTEYDENVIKKLLSGTSVTLNQKYKGNEDATLGQQQIDAEINLGDVWTRFSVWSDISLGDTSQKMDEIIKLPMMASQFFPDKFSGKQYMYWDLNAMSKSQSNLELVNMAKFSTDFKKKLITFLTEYAKQFEPGMSYVTQKSNNGELQVYELTLTNKSFNKLLQYTINNLADNKEAKDFVKEMLALVVTIYKSDDKKTETLVKSQMRDAINAVDKEWSKIKEASALVSNLNLLGKKGATIEFSINKDGYIVKENGSIDFNLDIINKIIELTGTKMPVDIENSLIINYSNDITSINKAVEIKYPELTDKNSFNLLDYQKYTEEEEAKRLKAFEEEQDQFYLKQGVTSVKINGQRFYFSEAPVNFGTLMIPVKDIPSMIGVEVSWNSMDNTIQCTKDGKEIKFTLNSKDVLVNGQKMTLSAAPYVSLFGNTFVPLKFMCEQFGCSLKWDQSKLTAYITLK